MQEYDVIIIGGGASGYFCAANLLSEKPTLKVAILEKTNKTLSKVKISGGGRCNVTHHTNDTEWMSQQYPRGKRMMQRWLKHFSAEDTVDWFQKRGVTLKVEKDGRMFPESNQSQTIIDCLTAEAQNADLHLKCEVEEINKKENGIWSLTTSQGEFFSKNVVLASGGFHKIEGYAWLQNLGLKIEAPIPSLFTFNIKDKAICQLQGVVAKNAIVKVGEGKKKFQEQGPVLITHWGFSGPAILKTSAFAAIWMFEKEYRYRVNINWLGRAEEEVRQQLNIYKNENPNKQTQNSVVFDIPKGLWEFALTQCGLWEVGSKVGEWNKKQTNKLVEWLVNGAFEIEGKTTFKEEFVTAGGVSLNAVNHKSMMLKEHEGIYAIGEVINVDGITGGFNFQNAWSSAFVAAQDILMNKETLN